MIQVTFYNRQGVPIAYTQDSKHIYLFSGEPAAYFYNDSVYSFSGNHLGRYTKGWIRDNEGDSVFFSENAIGGPTKPIKSLKPIKGIKSIKPIKSIKEIRPIKPINSISWSSFSSTNFFK